ncbi:MAG TPA: ATP-binding protein [Polyangiaceae bacterium]|jgi:NtrC-family two-component system sensor histidine kinase KinB|nr:ATP-binding protein [Polyangiaceae bacterium]
MTIPHDNRNRISVVPVSETRGREAPRPREHVLVVDDDANGRGALESALREEGFLVSSASDGLEGLAQAKRAMPDVVLTDLQMPRMDGLTLCESLHAIEPDLPVIVVTASSEMNSVVGSLRAGAEDYLVKPLNYDEVLWRVERAVARRRAKLEQNELYRTLNERLVLSSLREQEHAEAEARHSAQLNALLGNLSEGVAVCDRDGHVQMMNDAGRAILGFGVQDVRTLDELQSLQAHDLEGRPLPPEQRPLTRALRGERFADYEILHTRPDGERRRLLAGGTSVMDDAGQLALAIVVFRDVTNLRRAEEQRDEYLALISHDIRNPLSTALMFISMLKASLEKKGLGAEVGFAERAERNAMSINAMLAELTESTTLESQGLSSECVPHDLCVLVGDVVARLDDARARRITIETDDASPHVVLADVARLERVVANLLTNALKYSTDPAPVTVRVIRDGTMVELEVTDRGIGIEPESVDRLFERYYRTGAGKVQASGLGLGLYIARLIVEAHGGRIQVESEIGTGSTFRLSLPAAGASA